MKIIIIILTIIYFILVIVATFMSHCDAITHIKYYDKNIKEPTKYFIIENICKVISYAILIVDITFILVFFF